MGTEEDSQLIADHDDYCGTCKYFRASLCKPTESTNTWERWFEIENADCIRFPPVFVGSDTDCKTDEDEFDALNWQSPKVHAFCQGCGEYVRAEWMPNVELTGAAAALLPQRPATEGSEVERRVMHTTQGRTE